MIVLDASVWVSLLLTSDVHHQESAAWIAGQLAKQQTFAVPVLFSVEVGGAVRRRSGSADDATRSVSKIHRDPYFHIADLDRRFAAAAADVAVHLALKGADAIYVALAQHLSVPLVTWDNEQFQRGGHLVSIMTPAQALQRMP